MMSDLAIVLAVRTGSERLAAKALAEVQGQPLTAWIVRRLKQVPRSTVVLATTDRAEDRSLLDLAKAEGVPAFAGAADDVVGRMAAAVERHAPEAKLVMRALGDCPFLATELVGHAADCLLEHNRGTFAWACPPVTWPVYGAREFPMSRRAFRKLEIGSRGNAQEREHVDLFLHRNRDRFRWLYHEPPDSVYFRDYRLEVDWPEDLELVRAVAEGVEGGLLAPLPEVIRWLDAHQEVAAVNRHRTERTGPTVSYDYGLKREWVKAMRGQAVLAWDGQWWRPPDGKAGPVHCLSGRHLLGYGWKGELHTVDGHTIKAGLVRCPCGVRNWTAARERKRGRA